MNKIQYNVSGIENTETKTQLKNALGKINGISMVNIDAASSFIEVGYNQSTDESTIKSCIENVGCKIEDL
ncbi:MAG: heavy metal transporter [Clostridiales bacterium]|nr:heavy metal transporter [Clostridiales bacterium]